MSVCVCMSESAWSVWVSVYVHELYEHLVQYHSVQIPSSCFTAQQPPAGPAHLLKQNMYTSVTSVGALGWSVGRGATLSRNNMLQTKTASQVLFSFSIQPVLVIWWGRKGVFDSSGMAHYILWNNYSHGLGKGSLWEKKWNPSRKEMWCLSHYHATLVYCFAVACISETVFFCFLRECIKTIVLHQKKKKSLIEVNRAVLQRLFNLLELRLP